MLLGVRPSEVLGAASRRLRVTGQKVSVSLASPAARRGLVSVFVAPSGQSVPADAFQPEWPSGLAAADGPSWVGCPDESGGSRP